MVESAGLIKRHSTCMYNRGICRLQLSVQYVQVACGGSHFHVIIFAYAQHVDSCALRRMATDCYAGFNPRFPMNRILAIVCGWSSRSTDTGSKREIQLIQFTCGHVEISHEKDATMVLGLHPKAPSFTANLFCQTVAVASLYLANHLVNFPFYDAFCAFVGNFHKTVADDNDHPPQVQL